MLQVIADEQALVIINLRKKAKVVLTRDSEAHQVDHHLQLNSQTSFEKVASWNLHLKSV
jgi:hypothetical protein